MLKACQIFKEPKGEEMNGIKSVAPDKRS